MKRLVIMLMLLATVAPSLSGCFGKFALTRKVYDLNASVHDRILRHVVMWAFIIVPVYWVSGVVDLFIFNTLEFWTGNNPMAAGEKSFHYANGTNDFNVLAKWDGETITYTVDRYAGNRHLDTLVITSDRSGALATTTYREPGRVSTYAMNPGSTPASLSTALLLPREPVETLLVN
jgi:hypothetical protein